MSDSTSVTITMTGKQAVALHSLISDHLYGSGEIQEIIRDISVSIALNVDFGFIGSVQKPASIPVLVDVSDWEFVDSDRSYAFSTSTKRAAEEEILFLDISQI